MEGSSDEQYDLSITRDEHDQECVDFVTSQDVTREMTELDNAVWRWQICQFSVPDKLDSLIIIARGDMKEWVKQQREVAGDSDAAKALSALKCKKPRKLRQARCVEAACATGRARRGGRGGGRGSSDDNVWVSSTDEDGVGRQ